MKVRGFKDTIDWYNENAAAYDDASKNRAQIDLLDRFLSMLPKLPRILDAGCASGRDTEILSGKGAEVTGLDISVGFLKLARERNPDLDFVEGNFIDLPFKNKTFDGIWAHAALVHLEKIEDVKKSLQEFYRVLKEKGILHIFVKEQKGTEKTAIVEDTLSEHERFFRYYSKEEMVGYLTDQGFTIRELTVRQSSRRNEVNWICIFAEK